MNLQDLAKSMEDLVDVSEPDVAGLAASADPGARQLARAAYARSAIRRALAACGELAREQHYGEQSTLKAIQVLAGISDWDEPYVETLKQLGIQAADKGEIDLAMRYLQEAIFRGFSSGQRRAARSRRSMRYAHDAEIHAALERLAGSFVSPPFRPPSDRLKVVGLCTALADEDGPTVMTVKRMEYFKDEGFEVELVSTELGSSANTKMSERMRSLGIPVALTPPGTWEQRIRWLIAYFANRPADVLVYMTSAQDNLAKLAACIGLAPVQTWDVRALEPQCGKFDLMHNGISPDQETKTRWPGISRYTHPSAAMAEDVDAAVPFERADLELPQNGVLLGTFGRVEKANTPAYLEATAAILRQHPSALLLFAGPDSMNALPEMMRFYQAHGVAERVRYLGRRQSDGPRLIKTIDVYCDTYPWPGGQTLLDAMQAGRPIVAMKRADDPDLDPTGTGATSSVADVLLGGVVELAGAGDVDGYARIADAYIRDPALRAAHGGRLHDKAVRECSMRHQTQMYAQFIREAVAKKWGNPVSS